MGSAAETTLPPPRQPSPQGRCAWRSEGPGWSQSAPPLTFVITQRARKAEAPGPHQAEPGLAGPEGTGLGARLQALTQSWRQPRWPALLFFSQIGRASNTSKIHSAFSSVLLVGSQSDFIFQQQLGRWFDSKHSISDLKPGVMQSLCRTQPVCGQQKATRDQGGSTGRV